MTINKRKSGLEGKNQQQMIRGGELMTELKKNEWRKVKRRNKTAAFYLPADLKGIQGPWFFIYFGTNDCILWAWWIFIYIYFWIYFVQRGPVWFGRPATGPCGFPQVGSEEPDGVQKPSTLWKQEYFLWSAIHSPWSCAGIDPPVEAATAKHAGIFVLGNIPPNWGIIVLSPPRYHRECF